MRARPAVGLAPCGQSCCHRARLCCLTLVRRVTVVSGACKVLEVSYESVAAETGDASADEVALRAQAQEVEDAIAAAQARRDIATNGVALIDRCVPAYLCVCLRVCVIVCVFEKRKRVSVCVHVCI